MIKKLKISIYDYKIQLDDKNSNRWGWADRDKRIIHINPSVRSKHRDKLVTIFHEAIHAICKEYGILVNMNENEDEYLAAILENAVCQFFKDNKAFTKELIKYL